METELGRDLGQAPWIPECGDKPMLLENEKSSRMFSLLLFGPPC